MRPDLAKLLDDVCRRARTVELTTTLEHSIRCAVTTDRIGDAEAVVVRYADHPSEALTRALVDAAGWVNAQPHHGPAIATAWALPQLELAGALSALLSDVVNGRDTTGSVTKARDVLARWGAE